MFYFETEGLKKSYFSRSLREGSSRIDDLINVCIVKKTPSSRVESIIRSVYGDNFEIVPTGLILKKAYENGVKFSEELIKRCDKIDKITYFVVPKKEDEKTRSIGGFSDGNITVIGIRKVGLRGLFSSGTSFIDSLTSNAFTYLTSILVHELTHHVCGYTNKLFLKYRDVYGYFTNYVFNKAYSVPGKLTQLYMSLLNFPERSNKNFEVTTSLVNEYSRLNKEKSLHKDKNLAEEIFRGVNALISDDAKVASVLFHARALQDTIYGFYESLMKMGVSQLRAITFGQELLVPSEVLCVISQFCMYGGSLSTDVAKSVLNYLE